MTKRRLGIVFALVGGAAAAAFVIYRWRTSGFAWREFLDALRNVSWSWLAMSLLLVLSAYALRGVRWEVMLRPLLADSAPRPAVVYNCIVATCIGFAAVVMFGRAGEPVRPYLIARKEGVSFSSQVAAWVVERILDLLMVLIIFGLALSQVAHSTIRSNPRIETVLKTGGAAAGLIGLVCLVLLAGLRKFRGQVQRRLLDGLAFLPEALLKRAGTFLEAFGEGMQSTRSATFTLLLVAYTVLEWVLIAACFFCVFRAFPVTAGLRLTDIVIVLGFVAFGSVVQIPGVGGGMQIVCVLVLTEFYGMALEAATGVALTLWIVNSVAILPVGLTLAFREGIKWRNLKNIEASP